jgi:hypothetical protein
MKDMKNAVEMLEQFGIPYEVQVVSAHRTPDLMFEYASTAIFCTCLTNCQWPNWNTTGHLGDR